MECRHTSRPGRSRRSIRFFPVTGKLKAFSIAALLLAGLALQADLFAQPGKAAAVAPLAPPADGIALALPRAGAVATPSASHAWGGARTGAQATLSDRVVDYQIEATLDPVKHTIAGQQKLRWRNRSAQTVSSVYLHLYLNAFEGEHTTFFTEKRKLDKGFRSGVATRDGEWGYIELRSMTQNGARAPWHFVQPDNGPATDRTVVRVDLPQAVAAGAETTLDIDFFDQLPRVIARTGYFGSFHLAGQWFPKIAVLELPGERGATAPRWNAHEFHLNSEFYADFGRYDVKLTAPKDYIIGATGQLQGAPQEKDGMLTHHYVQGDVHDFAWTADKRSAQPLIGSWSGPGSPPVEIRVLYPPEYASNAAPALQAAKDSLAYFSRTLGPYPYATLTVVIPPFNAAEAGGMEYPTFITASSYASLQPKTIAGFGLDFVTIHEFGHGYFYGILASNEFEEPMLDEGLNEYWDQRMLRARGQDIHATTPWLKRLGLDPAFKVFEAERLAAPRQDAADPLGQNAWDRLQGVGPVYSRTAITLRDLEARIGSAAMETGFKAYYAQWKFRHPSIADLRETLAEATGQRRIVEQVFAQQVYATANIDDRIGSFTSVEQTPLAGMALLNGKRVERTAEALEKEEEKTRAAWDKAHPHAKPGTGPYPYLTSVVLRRRGAAVPQLLLVKFADGSSERVAWDKEQQWQRYTWLKPVKAVSAELDPDRVHYLDVNKLDDSRTLQADASAARRWSLDIAAACQYLLSLIAIV
ncbi:M1 family metallopeptidase [Janthinobacterium sp. GW458P]|uniref:M1 family metallopeptidase n=1 Tax=Janthinobacterium sp. GW458P TaxID=1981504 RepID=UPI001557B1A8|nr:M1 family metallopeptidase [Janthinobacterium sp. GW458P]MBE3026393.1 M1 family metallopeptidase [Janthinobacterium sp. GW458P]